MEKATFTTTFPKAFLDQLKEEAKEQYLSVNQYIMQLHKEVKTKEEK